MTRSLGAAAAAALLLMTAACGPSEEKLSDRRLHDEISKLRDNPSGSLRLVLLTTVKNLPAHTEDGRAAQAACLLAYSELHEAKERIALLEPQLAQARRQNAIPATISNEVRDTEALLAKARADMPACDAAAAKLALVAR